MSLSWQSLVTPVLWSVFIQMCLRIYPDMSNRVPNLIATHFGYICSKANCVLPVNSWKKMPIYLLVSIHNCHMIKIKCIMTCTVSKGLYNLRLNQTRITQKKSPSINYFVSKPTKKWAWWQTPILSTLRRKRQEDQKFKAILLYITNLRPVWDTRYDIKGNTAIKE